MLKDISRVNMISAQKINTRSIYQFVKRKKPIHWSQRYETRDIDKKIAHQRNEIYKKSLDRDPISNKETINHRDPMSNKEIINHKSPIVSLDESHHRDNPTRE